MAVTKEQARITYELMAQKVVQNCTKTIDDWLYRNPSGTSGKVFFTVKTADQLNKSVPELASKIREAYLDAGWEVGEVLTEYVISYGYYNITINGIQ